MRKRNRIPIIIGTLTLSASVFAGGLVMTNAANNDDGCYEDKYFNAHQAYEGLKNNKIPTTHITQDTKCNQIWWVRRHHDAEKNKYAQNPNKQNEGCVGYVLGWRVVISAVDSSNKTYSMTCDIPDAEMDSFKAVTEFTNANDNGVCENEKQWYTLYALDLNTLYDYMAANNASTAEAINKCSNADIYIYPIATYRYGIAEPAGGITYNKKGITGTNGKVYYGDNKTEWDKFDAYLMEKNGRTYAEFPDSGYFQRSYDGKISAEPGECTYRFELGDTSDTKLQKSELNFKPGWSVNKDGYLYHNNQLYKSYHKLLKTDPLLDASEFSVGGDVANLRTGYTINNGWYVNGTENKAGAFGDRGYGRNLSNSNETLTCKWTEHSYVIEYNSNGGTGFVQPANPTYSEEVTLNDGTGLYRSGYNFAGWSTNPNATEPDKGKEPGAKVSKLIATDSGDSVKLYAVWQPGEYDVTLKQEGGSNGTESVVEKFGKFFGTRNGKGNLSSVSGVKAPKKTGYNFSGYFSGANGTGDKIVDENSTFTSKVFFDKNDQSKNVDTNKYFTSDSDIYANYTPKTPTVTFDKQGGEGGADNTIATYGDYLPAGLSAPVRLGWTFSGYYTGKNGTGTQYYTNTMGIVYKNNNPVKCDFENDITLYAYWTDTTPAKVDMIGNVIKDKIEWMNTDVPISICATDYGSGIKSITVYMDGTEDKNIVKTIDKDSKTDGFTEGMERFSDTVTCTAEGIHTMHVEVVDMSGNKSQNDTTIFIDKTAPHATGENGITVTDDGVTWNSNGTVTDYK